MAVRTEPVREIKVAFPADVLNWLDSLVPSEERDRFIVEATEHALRQKRLREVVSELRQTPAWSDEDHPDLMTVEDVDRYIRRLRETWVPRTWDEIAEEAEKRMVDGQPPTG